MQNKNTQMFYQNFPDLPRLDGGLPKISKRKLQWHLLQTSHPSRKENQYSFHEWRFSNQLYALFSNSCRDCKLLQMLLMNILTIWLMVTDSWHEWCLSTGSRAYKKNYQKSPTNKCLLILIFFWLSVTKCVTASIVRSRGCTNIKQSQTGICSKWWQCHGDHISWMRDVTADGDLLNLDDWYRLSCTRAENIRLPPCNWYTNPPPIHNTQQLSIISSRNAATVSSGSDIVSKIRTTWEDISSQV